MKIVLSKTQWESIGKKAGWIKQTREAKAASLSDDEIDLLIESGDIVRCSACGELSALSWDYVTPKSRCYLRCWDAGEIAHVGATSMDEFECGHCGANNVEPESPILSPANTHSQD